MDFRESVKNKKIRQVYIHTSAYLGERKERRKEEREKEIEELSFHSLAEKSIG